MFEDVIFNINFECDSQKWLMPTTFFYLSIPEKIKTFWYQANERYVFNNIYIAVKYNYDPKNELIIGNNQKHYRLYYNTYIIIREVDDFIVIADEYVFNRSDLSFVKIKKPDFSISYGSWNGKLYYSYETIQKPNAIIEYDVKKNQIIKKYKSTTCHRHGVNWRCDINGNQYIGLYSWKNQIEICTLPQEIINKLNIVLKYEDAFFIKLDIFIYIFKFIYNEKTSTLYKYNCMNGKCVSKTIFEQNVKNVYYTKYFPSYKCFLLKSYTESIILSLKKFTILLSSTTNRIFINEPIISFIEDNKIIHYNLQTCVQCIDFGDFSTKLIKGVNIKMNQK